MPIRAKQNSYYTLLRIMTLIGSARYFWRQKSLLTLMAIGTSIIHHTVYLIFFIHKRSVQLTFALYIFFDLSSLLDQAYENEVGSIKKSLSTKLETRAQRLASHFNSGHKQRLCTKSLHRKKVVKFITTLDYERELSSVTFSSSSCCYVCLHTITYTTYALATTHI